MSLSVKEFFAGWGGGVCGLLVGQPADTIKIKQQVFERAGIFKILISTVKHEGIYSLYRGSLFPFLIAGIQSSVFFGMYGNILRTLQRYQNADINRRTCSECSIPNRYWHFNVYLAGSTAAFVHGFLACPVDLIKITIQTKTSLKEKSQHRLMMCIKTIYLNSGVFGFYHGLLATLIRDVPVCGFYVLLYEHLLTIGRSEDDKTCEYSIFSQLLSGGLAGSITWVAVTPLDVVKSRIQADNIVCPKYKGIIDCFIKSYKEEGLYIFGRGFWIHILRGFPVNAATFVGYEQCLKMYLFFEE